MSRKKTLIETLDLLIPDCVANQFPHSREMKNTIRDALSDYEEMLEKIGVAYRDALDTLNKEELRIALSDGKGKLEGKE